MEQENFVKKKLHAGKPILGTWSLVSSPTIAEIMGDAGLDFQILDMEHGVFDIPTLEASIRACEVVGCSPLVRSAGLDAPAIQNILDLGAHGIIVPRVNDYACAAAAVQATKYPPAGIRGFNPFTRAGGYRGGQDGPQTKQTNSFGLTSVIIENHGAYQDLDRILGIEGLDMLYLGAYDMSVALGCMGRLDDPRLIDFLESSIPKIRDAGKAAGVMVKNDREMRRYLKLGANVLVYAVDAFVISNAIRAASSAFAQASKRIQRSRA